jgi:hypothetical protein
VMYQNTSPMNSLRYRRQLMADSESFGEQHVSLNEPKNKTEKSETVDDENESGEAVSGENDVGV